MQVKFIKDMIFTYIFQKVQHQKMEPSAGITMALQLASVLSEKAIKADVAMTGELTLSGKKFYLLVD